MKLEPLKIQHDLVAWLTVAGDKIRQSLTEELQVNTKSGRNDLVTNRDKEIERFYVNQIRTYYPEARIYGEEGFGDEINDLSGLIFFVDPIDGTMNFVKQKENFATMIGVYLDGEPIVGGILDVMAQRLVVGGPQTGVMLNGRPLSKRPNLDIKDGLIGVNSRMLSENINQVTDLIRLSSGARITGSAGVEFSQVIMGKQIGYISNLSPWDVAAGWAIASALNIEAHTIAGQRPSLLKREIIIAGIPTVWQNFAKLQS